jgi:hypothetical protein
MVHDEKHEILNLNSVLFADLFGPHLEGKKL